MGKISERKKQLYTWYFNKMYEIAKGNGLELQLADTWAHSLQVWATACELLNQILSKNEIDIDVEFVEFACFVHDIGRMVTGSPASYTKCPNHGFSHGPIGAAIVREQDFLQGCPAFPEKYQSSDELQKALARICERHTGCVGMSKKNYPANHHLFSAPTEWDEIAGVEGIFVSTIEEKIVGIADFLTEAHKVCPSRAGNNNIFFIGRRMSMQQQLQKVKGWDTEDVIWNVVCKMQKLAPNFLNVDCSGISLAQDDSC